MKLVVAVIKPFTPGEIGRGKIFRPRPAKRGAHLHRRNRRCGDLRTRTFTFTDRSNTMMIKKPKRAGLAAFIFAVLLGLCLTLSFHTRVYAQAPAEESTQVVETLACDSKVQKECSPNSGDTAWMLTSMAIVLMMTVPGLALFYGGMVRKKNVGDTVMTSFAITCL